MMITVSNKKDLKPGTKYQLLVASAESGTCYSPDCVEDLLVERAGQAVPNFDFAHIRDELPPKGTKSDLGWRYWPEDLSHAERQHFATLDRS